MQPAGADRSRAPTAPIIFARKSAPVMELSALGAYESLGNFWKIQLWYYSRKVMEVDLDHLDRFREMYDVEAADIDILDNVLSENSMWRQPATDGAGQRNS